MPYTIYFDFETGGVLPTHPSIQLAAIAVDDASRKEVSSFEAKLTFDEKQATPEALTMNHYDKTVWDKEALSPPIVAKRFARWSAPFQSIPMVSARTGNSYTIGKLAGYNALTFDLPRLRDLFGTEFFPFAFQVRDILQRVIFHFDEHPSLLPPSNYKLPTVCAYFGINTDNAHEALADVRLTHALYERLRA